VDVLNRSTSQLETSRGVAVADLTETPMSARAIDLKRFMLWIDAVGGYLVCLADEIIIGQSTPGSGADIALQADLSRKHAKINRVSGGYLLEPIGGTAAVSGRPISEAVLLSDGDEIQLAAVKMRFRKPHVLSSSACLEFTSGHRSQPHADAIILMAESCVVGPQWQNHIVCREWTSDIVLYRKSGQILLRASQPVQIDNRHYNRPAPIHSGSRILSDDFSFSIEAI
jgi:hypothetical protein